MPAQLNDKTYKSKPIVQNNNTSNSVSNGHPTTTSFYDHEDYRDPHINNSSNGLTTNNTPTLLDNAVPQIDPPEGFQPENPPPCMPSTSGQRNRTQLVERSASSSTSSQLSSTSSSNDNFSNLMKRTSVNQTGDGCGVAGQSDTNTNSTNSNNQHTRSQLTSDDTRVHSGQNGSSSNATANHVQSMIQRKKSSASSAPTPTRIFDRFSNIMTKITKALTTTPLSMISTDSCLLDEMPRFAFSHRRSLEKTWKLMDKVVNCCQRPEMNLTNSPPFILDILPETYQQLKAIHNKYDSSSKYPENDSGYSQVFLLNLQTRCKQTLKLFKVAKEEMYNEDSEHRHKLTRHTLVFNHILSELKAIFPKGEFIGEKYLITKKETAGEFWKNNFGSSVLVDWISFYHALQAVHSIDSSFFSSNALKQTIDLTCDDFISIFEFDVFTRLFQPWATLLKNWQILAVTHPGYKAFLTYDELKARLQKYIDKPGSYVYRLSCTRLGQWAIGYVTPTGEILQTIVQNISLSQALTETKIYLYPDGKDEDPNLNILCSEMAGEDRNVTVTAEQYEIYCGVGNPFQTCKICFENDKDIRVEPCNHLLCTSCLIAWQESHGESTCPYCRTEIKETVQITVDLSKTRR